MNSFWLGINSLHTIPSLQRLCCFSSDPILQTGRHHGVCDVLEERGDGFRSGELGDSFHWDSTFNDTSDNNNNNLPILYIVI